MARATQSRWRTSPSTMTCGQSARIRRSVRLGATWGFPTARWAIPRSGTSTWARGASSTKSSRASTTRARTVRSRKTRSSSRPSTRQWPPGTPCISSACFLTVACTATWPTSRRSSRWRPNAVHATCVCTRSWTAATSTPRAAPATCSASSTTTRTYSSSIRAPRSPFRQSRVATMPWTATGAGIAFRRRGRPSRWQAARGLARAVPCRRSTPPTTRASPTSSSSRRCLTTGACATATR